MPTMVAYGFGQLAEAVKNNGFSVFLLFYYNQVLHVSATGTSIALAIALIFDAVTDPLAGSLSDKLRSSWGRRHPFILAAALPLAISFYFLFNPPDDLSEFGNIVWLGVFAILVRGSMTFYHVPHMALGADLAPDYDQRSTLYSFNTLFGFTGAAIFVPVSYLLFFPTTEEFSPGLLNQAAYSPWAVFGGAIMIFSVIVCVVGTFSEVPRLREQAAPVRIPFSPRRLLKEMIEVFASPSFRAIFFGMLLSVFVLSVEAVFNPFMGFHFWGMTTEQLSLIPIGQVTGLILSILMVPVLTRRFDKRPTLIACALITIVNMNAPIVLKLMEVDWFPAEGSTPLLIILILNHGLTAFLAPIVLTSLASMFADLTDEHELDSGERREGVIFAARAFIIKATASMGLVFGGVLLDFIQFPRGATMGSVPEDIVWQLGFITGPATSIFTFFGMAFYLGYRIDRRRHTEIMAELARRKT